MKRLLIVSDSHGRDEELEAICRLHPEAERILFLGDGADDFEWVDRRHPEWAMLGVRGNCDWNSLLPRSREVLYAGKRFLCAHGHEFALQTGLGYLTAEARARGCDAVFFGHTHQQYCSADSGVLALNPGAVSDPRGPRYALLDITEEGELIPQLIQRNAGEQEQ